MLNRHQMPPIRPIGHLSLPTPRQWQMGNGMPVYSVELGTQDVVRIEVIFRAGRPYEAKPLVARAAINLLREGTGTLTADALAEHFDFYGALLTFPFNLDTANVAISCLNRHLPAILPVFADMLATPTFPERELALFIRRNQRLLREDLSKNDVLAYREVTERFFGAHHPYGYNSFPETYGQLQRHDLVDHHQRLFHGGNGLVLLAGKITPEVETLVARYLGQLPGGAPAPAPNLTVTDALPHPVKITRPGALQTALRVGRRLFSRHHPDAPGFHVLNTLLGGYFGSRLMTNIREDKGYTYSIDSAFDTMRFDGCFYVDAEVGNEVVEKTLVEIDHEIDRLRTDLASDQEMEMLRNYLLGTYLGMLDGPFSQAETIRTLLNDELPFETFHQLVETTRHITADELRQLAQKYLDPATFWRVTVGP